MSRSEARDAAGSDTPLYNRVPYVTVDFWLIKLMAVTVGETAADFLSETLGFGLSKTSLFMTGVLIGALAVQFSRRRYAPWAYWIAVVLVSIVGTLITDNLTDNLGYSLVSTTTAFSIVLAITFAVWYVLERTLSIHTIFTTRRETFYWLAILLTFALGTAAGDLTAEKLGLGYLSSGIAFGVVIAAIAFAYFVLELNGILAFWLAYILTRPLGASFGDYLAQPVTDGGVGLGTVLTSLVFLTVIAGIIVYMTRSGEGLEYVTSSDDEQQHSPR